MAGAQPIDNRIFVPILHQGGFHNGAVARAMLNCPELVVGLSRPKGVSGAPGGDKDEACAKSALDKAAGQLK
jgi:hypothetical protein